MPEIEFEKFEKLYTYDAALVMIACAHTKKTNL